MKTKLEDFKDRSELFQWAADRKPIDCKGSVYRADVHGDYRNMNLMIMQKKVYRADVHGDYRNNYGCISFIGELSEYKKVIEIETKVINKSHDLFAYIRDDSPEFSFIPYEIDGVVFAKLKITAIIEKCKETGEIVDKKFTLEEVE